MSKSLKVSLISVLVIAIIVGGLLLFTGEKKYNCKVYYCDALDLVLVVEIDYDNDAEYATFYYGAQLNEIRPGGVCSIGGVEIITQCDVFVSVDKHSCVITTIPNDKYPHVVKNYEVNITSYKYIQYTLLHYSSLICGNEKVSIKAYEFDSIKGQWIEADIF